MRKDRNEGKELEFLWVYWVYICMCIALCSQYELIWFASSSPSTFQRQLSGRASAALPASRSDHSPVHLTFCPLPLPPSALPTRPPARLAATRRCSAAAPSSSTTSATATKAATASLYQHTSARQMIHPLHVLQTNTLPPSRCLSAVWFICLSPHIAASPPDAFSFRQIIDST